MGTGKAVATACAALMVLTVGCAADDSDFQPNNRGADTETPLTTVDNAFIVPDHAPGKCAIQVGSAANLSFTATNTRPAESERLLGITTEAADTVRVSSTGEMDIAPKSSEEFTAAVEGLRDSIRPAMSVDVTFRFLRSGDIEMRVPIEACPAQDG